MFKFTNDETGLSFTARVIDTGDNYGKDNCLVNDGKPLVEFYDARYDFTPGLGQFVTRYYVDTIKEHQGGLILDGGVPDWTISASNVSDVQRWLEG